MKEIIVSGMRSTRKLHLGHYLGVIQNWVQLQDKYDCYFFVADWHALTTKYDKTEHHYNIRVSESTELIIESSLAGYRVKKTGSDIVYQSLYDNNEDYVYLNEGEYQILYYSSSSEKEYSLKLTFKQKNFEQDTFTCNVIEIGKEYSFDFQTQDYYLFKLNINDDLCFNYTGNVITYRCYDAAYVFVTKLEINDNMWNSYDIGRDYFYIIVMKDQTNEGKFLVLSRVSSH